MKRVFRWLSLFYLFGLGLALLALRWLGEGSMYAGPALYFPAWIWILPGIFLAVMALLFDRRMGLILGAVALWYGGSYLGFHWNRPLVREPGDLTVLSCNLGLDQPATVLSAFVQQQKPDIIAIQEAYGQLEKLRRAFPGYEGKMLDQFPILSRHPIESAEIIELQEENRRVPCAVRYVIAVNDRKVALYNVHLTTPRSLLATLRGRPRLLLPFRMGGLDRKRWDRQQEDWAQRADQIREFVGVLKEEKLPMIVVGDFNMTIRGSGYPQFTAFLQDAFAEGGRGFGWTFPCDRPARLDPLTPWVRIDHQFASSQWRVAEAVVEPKRRAQHLATAARYRWK